MAWIFLQVLTGYLLEGGQPISGSKVGWGGIGFLTQTDSAGRFTFPPPPHFPAWLVSTAGQDSLRIDSLPSGPIVWDIARKKEIETQVIQATREGVQAEEAWSQAELNRAPCCVVSEAFESTAQTDIILTDGIIGLKQVRLMGLEPHHTLLLYEQKPLGMGHYRPWALHFTPTLWVRQLSLAKGIGSVFSGYEGAAGQVALSYEEAQSCSDSLTGSIETFARSTGEFWLMGRGEMPTRSPWRFLLLGSAGWTPFQTAFLQDHNHDGFLDIPLYRHGHGLIRLHRREEDGAMTEIDIEGLHEYRWGGEVAFRSPEQIPRLEAWGFYQRLSWGQSSLRKGWVLSEGKGLSLLGQVRILRQELTAGFNTYFAQQPIGWVQVMYRHPWVEKRVVFMIGASTKATLWQERLTTWHNLRWHGDRREIVGSLIAEAEFRPKPTLWILGGIRIDGHSYWGMQIVPRLLMRWNAPALGTLRLAVGRFWRVPDPVLETLPFLQSTRVWVLPPSPWVPLERGWSTGTFWQRELYWGRRGLRITADGLYSFLRSPLLWNAEKPWRIAVQSAQRPAHYFAFHSEIRLIGEGNFQASLSYKWQKVQWHIENRYQVRPLLPQHRAVLWLTQKNASNSWQGDIIISGWGTQRLPSIREEPLYTPAYLILTLQLTRRINGWEIQTAIENLTNYRQPTPILGAERPFAPGFDAALIWAPIMGRMVSLTLQKQL
ncbi:MAG: TonB-dependent receptor [Bacteroidia bacterium]|nr:TonB-dependent receptor [Bacteroidia bacterium]